MERIFRMLQNSFEIQTRGSHKKAVSLLTDTVEKLQASSNPLLVLIYTNFLPFFNAYITLNDAVGMLEGTYKGKTNLFETLIDGVDIKLRQWEGAIRAVFIEDSPTEIEIFPNKRGPFQTGTYEQRLGAIRILRDKLLEYTAANPTLVPVQSDVAAFYTLCDTARATQQGKEGNLNDARSQREAQRVVTMNAYMGIVYGGLLQQLYTDLTRVGDFIDFSILYDLVSEDLLADIDIANGNTVFNVPLDGVTVTGNKKFRIIVKDDTNTAIVLAYFAIGNKDQPSDPPKGIALNAGDNRIVTAAELGFDPTHTFLNLFTANGVAAQVQVYEVA